MMYARFYIAISKYNIISTDTILSANLIRLCTGTAVESKVVDRIAEAEGSSWPVLIVPQGSPFVRFITFVYFRYKAYNYSLVTYNHDRFQLL